MQHNGTSHHPSSAGHHGFAGPARRARRIARPGRLIAAAAGLAVVVVLAVAVVLAQAIPGWAVGGGIAEVKSFAAKLTGYVTALAASVAVLFMAISGIRWTMSAGNPMRQTEARNGLVSAAAGLAIALSANAIVSLVIAALR